MKKHTLDGALKSSFELRDAFVHYFTERGHTHVPSSSLIPAQDPTLLFTNAGMNQFKDLFLGNESRSYTKAVTIQKCIRAGGKHNDLENVGYTKRHLTFFEMMGSFSFGDYFKKEAIKYAWQFLTEVVKLNKEHLVVTVHKNDKESYTIWKDVIKVPEDRIIKLGDEDNFWQMGDTGPCGPCTEIFVDRGAEYSCGSKECLIAEGSDRFLEVWNLVFMEFDRQTDGTDVPLANKGVDTGMGLARLCSVVQGTETVFETDLFMPLIKRIEEITGTQYDTAPPEIQAAFRVLSDHIRSSCFAIADGGTPSNEGRGYVIRKIIRRAALFAQKLGNEKIFPTLAPALIEYMSPVYPELETQRTQIISVLTSEVEKFHKAFLNGQHILEGYFTEAATEKRISGAQAFKLYDTYGFPLELTNVMAHERGYTLDTKGFEEKMELQKQRSGKKQQEVVVPLDPAIVTRFTGYEELANNTHVTALVVDNNPVESVAAGTQVFVVTDATPFFVACGGQVNDTGTVYIGKDTAPLEDLKKFGDAIGVQITTPVPLKIGDPVRLEVDHEVRINTMKNHTATHLLQAALIELLGNQVRQSGSVVTPDYLRFDFTYHETLTQEHIKWVEDRVNQKIRENIPVDIFYTSLEAATEKGVIAIFGEKYQPEKVRVIDIPSFSAELCGGTHVPRTGDIGAFKITEETALSSGNRRMFAVTGPAAINLFQDTFNTCKKLGTEFKVPIDQVIEAIAKQKEQLKATQTALKKLKKAYFMGQLETWAGQAAIVGTIPFLYRDIEDAQIDDLREIGAALQKKKPGLYVLISSSGDRTMFVATMSPDYVGTVPLEQLATWFKAQGIKCGGKGTTLQGSIPPTVTNLDTALQKWLSAQS